MKIHKIFTGIMASGVMVASISAGEVVLKPSLLRRAGNVIAKPFTFAWGKVKTNPKKTAGVVATGVAGSAAYALGRLPSKEAVISFFSKGADCVPSAQQVQDFANGVLKQCTLDKAKQLLKRLNDPKAIAATFTALGLAYVWRTYAQKQKAVQKANANKCTWGSNPGISMTDNSSFVSCHFNEHEVLCLPRSDNHVIEFPRPNYNLKNASDSICYYSVDTKNLQNSGMHLKTVDGDCYVCNECVKGLSKKWNNNVAQFLKTFEIPLSN